MSEPSSLVMQVHLTQAEWARFLASEILPVRHFDDWNGLGPEFDPAWLDKVDYGQSRTVQDCLAQDLPPPWPDAPVPLGLDWERNCVTCVVFEYSENFIEYVQGLNVLRGVARHKTSNDPDFILIYPHFWAADHVAAAIQLSAGQSRLLDKSSDRTLIRCLRARACELLETYLAPLRERSRRNE